MDEQQKPLKIVGLQAENVKRIKAVDITPKGNTVTLTGRNAQGKTSILDCIWWALAGTKHIQVQPIRKGANSARIRLDLGEFIVTRRFTEGKDSTLRVESADGASYPSPQRVLDAFLGALTFDPLDFARMDANRQFETLRKVVPLDVDIDLLNRQNKGDFDRRTELNRDAKAKRAAANAIVVATPVPDTLIDENGILDEIQRASKVNADIELERDRRSRALEAIAEHVAKAADFRAEANEFRRRADRLDSAAAARDQQAANERATFDALPDLPTPIDPAGLRATLDQAKATNERIRAVGRRMEFEADAIKLEEQADALTEAMFAREQAKREAIARAKMPVPGLGFGDGIVTLNEIPFDQASDAEKLQVSLGIAIAANPRLRVIRIRDASLLDDDAMATVHRMAREADCQVWMELVDTSGKVGVVIEDGMVAAVNEEAQP